MGESADGPVALSRIEDRGQFEVAIDTRFQKLDRDLAMLEVRIFQEGLRERFAVSLSRLYNLRNGAALAIAEAETAPDKEFPSRKAELVGLIDQLGALLGSAAVAVDSMVVEREPPQPTETLWLWFIAGVYCTGAPHESTRMLGS